MPRISDSRKVIKATIESIPGSKVELWDTMTVGDIEQVQHAEGTEIAKTIQMLTIMIKSWNLQDDNDKTLPITEDNIRLLSIKDLENLIAETSMAKQALKSEDELEDEAVEKKTD